MNNGLRFALKHYIKNILFLSLALAPWGVLAEELPENYFPVRPLGMGGAFTAISDDQNAIWTNPAGIGHTRKPRSRNKINLLTIPNINVGSNNEARASFSTLDSSGKGETSDQAVTAIENAIDAAGGSTDKPIWGFFSAAPTLYLATDYNASAAFSLFSNNRVKIAIEDPTSNLLRTEIVSDIGGVLGASYGTKLNAFTFGIQLRPTLRYAYDDSLPAADVLDKTTLKKQIEQGANTGTGIGLDMGLLWTIPDFWFPTFGLAVFNLPTGCVNNYLNPYTELRQTICGTTYSGKVNNPDSLFLVDPTDIRMGFSITPRITNKLALRFDLDVHHLYIPSGTTFYGLPGVDASKLVHAGLEAFLGNPLLLSPFSVRVGYGGGFTSAGLTLRLRFLLLEFATYGADISSTPTAREDRRLMLSASIED